MDDSGLLRCYVEERSYAAFTELVQRHVHLVYFAALRQTQGDSHRVRETAQTVFTRLARKAAALTAALAVPSAAAVPAGLAPQFATAALAGAATAGTGGAILARFHLMTSAEITALTAAATLLAVGVAPTRSTFRAGPTPSHDVDSIRGALFRVFRGFSG